MRALIVAAAAAFVLLPAQAARVASHESQGGSVTLFDDRCPLKMPHESFANRASMQTAAGETYNACFRVNGPWIELIYEDGDIGKMPAEVFKMGPGLTI